MSFGSSFLTIGQTTGARELNKSLKGSVMNVANHFSNLGYRWPGPLEVSRVESSLWTRQGVKFDYPPSPMESVVLGWVVRADDGIEEFVEELGLLFELFDDNTCLAAELAISLNMGKEHFPNRCCQGCDARFVFPPGQPHNA